MSHRRNWVPPPPTSQASVSPPLDPKGEATLSCGGVGDTQFGRLDRKPGTLDTLWDGVSIQKNNAKGMFKIVHLLLPDTQVQ